MTYKESMSSRNSSFLDSFMSGHTWKIVDLPPGSKPIGCKWVFKRKYYTDSTLQTFKARLLANDFRQIKELIALRLIGSDTLFTLPPQILKWSLNPLNFGRINTYTFFQFFHEFFFLSFCILYFASNHFN